MAQKVPFHFVVYFVFVLYLAWAAGVGAAVPAGHAGDGEGGAQAL